MKHFKNLDRNLAEFYDRFNKILSALKSILIIHSSVHFLHGSSVDREFNIFVDCCFLLK